jgi:hypothetical protein
VLMNFPQSVCLHYHCRTRRSFLTKDVASFSETLMLVYKIIRHIIPEDWIFTMLLHCNTILSVLFWKYYFWSTFRESS